MDKNEAVMKAGQFLEKIKSIIQFEKAYLFGSYTTGTYRKDSDIDIGIFVSSLNDEYFTLLKKVYRLRRSVDPRIEPHIFISGRDPSGFAEEVERTGLKIG